MNKGRLKISSRSRTVFLYESTLNGWELYKFILLIRQKKMQVRGALEKYNAKAQVKTRIKNEPCKTYISHSFAKIRKESMCQMQINL